MLMVNRTLKHLDIDSNKIQDDGVRDIMEGLQHNDTLTELELDNCECCQLLSHPSHPTSHST